jgi:hypothetical protein
MRNKNISWYETENQNVMSQCRENAEVSFIDAVYGVFFSIIGG